MRKGVMIDGGEGFYDGWKGEGVEMKDDSL